MRHLQPSTRTTLTLLGLTVALACPACAVVLGFEEPAPGELTIAGPTSPGDVSASEDGGPAAPPTPSQSSAGEDAASPARDASLDAPADDGSDGSGEVTDPGKSSCVCEPVVPSGWSGPLALMEGGTQGKGAQPAACSGDYAVELALGRTSPSAPPAQCGCACAAPTGIGCTASSIQLYEDGACSKACGAPASIAAGACVDARPAAGSCAARDVAAARALAAEASGGSCAPSATVVVPDLEWGGAARLCGATAPPEKGSCAEGSVCASPRTTPFSARRCIAHVGAVACPAPWTSKSTYYESAIDTRSCTACTCDAPTGASCASTVTGYRGNVCEAKGAQKVVGGACTSLGGVDLLDVAPAVPAGGACTPSGGAPTGSVEPAAPLTVCCL